MTTTSKPATEHHNVSQAELDKFSALASRWWDPESEFKPLHAINPLRLGWIREQAGGSLNGLRILDVGCGGGILAESMAAQGAEVKGIDLADASLQVARLHSLESGIKVDYESVAVEALAEREPGSYDVVTCMEMLEHVPDPSSVVQACSTLLKPGGLATFSTLNRNAKSFLFAIVGAEYILKLLPRGTHQHDKFIKPSELAAYVRRAGLTALGLRGLEYNPLTQHYRLSGDTSVNYMMATTK
ncbi:3-demethylubiquinone-9 3-methyltransferase [Kerstersia gyiorum]|uniref:Ubiquinone biosynthesis O-methyltransferase n=1 Tax=Kerstersia gyiorum TaxID=206506 RepID=A0A4Q7MYW7_9BURK|nr:bifunctional 2-polyprenyl-6-hydroxyphenol methylase/3-demethylubiquinol 3-O-methyltransferase UbiG [Kerstersia gyiorum]KAB0542749.1 bifunctional 2-polyprenyl-6-hydroxyphenol methylase/3-demethylubiquinol 3-O-methyltransferase UbiG [Kerstersia gyiorum]RZS73983.1 3-demethylubiquinone-9 3-methyltransferase [Kerstersia gyiorum]